MHSALLVIEKKDAMTDDDERIWAKLMSAARQTLEKSTQIEALAENVFLLPLRSDLHTLASLIASCLQYRDLSYRVLLLSDEPQWINRPSKKSAHPDWDKSLPRANNGVV